MSGYSRRPLRRTLTTLAVALWLALTMALAGGLVEGAHAADGTSGGAPYGASPLIWSHTVDAHPLWTAPVTQLSALPSLPALRLAAAGGGAGVVQGHVYDYVGGPVANATVTAFAVDDQGNWLWSGEAGTGDDGFYSISGAPASAHGRIFVNMEGGDSWAMKEVAFADPGPSTYDLRPARVTWSATRGGPWGADWQDPFFEVAGMSATATPVYAMTHRSGVSTGATVTGWASALPADVRLVAFYFYPNEVAVWDAADPGNSPLPVTVGSTTTLPFTFDEASAYRSFLTRPYWASGKPGTKLRLALQNFPAGSEVAFSGWSESPNDASTTWGGKSLISTGPQRQTVSLTVPAKAAPGYSFIVAAGDATARYNIVGVAAMENFQVCTLNATKTSIRRGSAVKLRGVVPVQNHWGSTAGKAKYVWIYKRTTAASAPPTVWDATKKGWKLAARVRTDRYGRYNSVWLKPARTTWYVARYAGDEQYRKAYTSVLKVRVY